MFISRISDKGFTLIEVLLTITILAVGIIGVLRAYATSVNALEVAQCSLDAVYLLKEKMADIDQYIIENSGIPTGVTKGEFEGKYDKFKWESEISRLDLDIEDLKEELKDYLNELKITVVNEHVKPVRRLTLVTYVENEAKP